MKTKSSKQRCAQTRWADGLELISALVPRVINHCPLDFEAIFQENHYFDDSTRVSQCLIIQTCSSNIKFNITFPLKKISQAKSFWEK